MSTSRRVSKRKQNGGTNFGGSKRSKVALTHTFFTQCLETSGVSLSDGSLQNTISVTATEFSKELLDVLQGHHPDLDTTIEEFINDFGKYTEDYSRFHKLLLETIDMSDNATRQSSLTLPSVVKLLLSVSELQKGVAGKVIERLFDFTSGEPSDTNLGIKEVRQIPKLILNQLRWLDFLVDGKELSDKLLECVVMLPTDIQRDVILSLPDIIEDQQHGHVAAKLKTVCDDYSELLTACIDTWSELNMDINLATEILDLVMDRVKSAEIEDLPVVLNYVLKQKFNSKSVVDTLAEIRDGLDTVSCFTPLPTLTSTPFESSASQRSTSGGFVVLDCIQVCLERLKVIANGWIKVIESVEEEKDHKILDLFVLFVLHGLPNNSKTIRNVIVNKVKSQKFTEVILEHFFQHKIPSLKNLFPSILSIAEHLLSTPSPTVCSFAQKLYKCAFVASDVYRQQDIIGTLVALVSSGTTGECNSALDILEDLVYTYPTQVGRFSALLKNILDHLLSLDLDQIRKVYVILSMLAYGVGDECDSGLDSELESIIRKQLHNQEEKYRHNGVIAAVMAVKQIAQIRVNTEGTFSVLNEDIQPDLSPTRKQHAEDILKQVFTVAGKNHVTGSLFFDEMANVVKTCSIHEDILEVIRDQVTELFQEEYVIEKTDLPCDGSTVALRYEYDLETPSEDDEEENSIAINMFQCVMDSIQAMEKQHESSYNQESSTGGRKIEAMCSNFKLLRILEQSVNKGLSEVDALLGCPIILPDPKVLEVGAFNELQLEVKKVVCATLFHTINWFRELLSAFAYETEPDMRAKVLQRLDNITTLQQTLNTCLQCTPGPIPTVVPDNTATSDADSKPTKRKPSTSKSKIDTTLATTATATQLENGGATLKDTTVSIYKKTTASDALLRLKPYFRELDLSTYSILSYEPLSRSVLDSALTSEGDISLESPQLLFLLQELCSKVSTQFSLFAAKKKSRDKESTTSRDKEVANMMSHCIVPALCDHLERINSYLQTHAGENDGVLDSSIDSTHISLRLKCFQLICKALTTFHNWILLADPMYEGVLKESLQCFAGRISQSSTQENASLTLITSKAFKYLERFADYIPSLVIAASLCKLIVAIQKITKVKEIKPLTAEFCGKLLKRSWTDLDNSSGSVINESLESIIKFYIEWSRDPLDIIEDIYGNGIPDLEGEDGRDQSQLYPTLTLKTFISYYRTMSSAVVTCVKNIPSVNSNGNFSSEEELLESFTSLQISVKHYCALVNYVKMFDLKGVLNAALKTGRRFIEAFIKTGIPIVDLLFKLRKDDVMATLKTLQQATRCLQHFCGHSKVEKDVTLTKHVPILKKCLESLLFRVKEMVIHHKCFEAFWMGSLRNRDLQGQIIPTQVSQEPSETDTDRIDDEEDCNSTEQESAATAESYVVSSDEEF